MSCTTRHFAFLRCNRRSCWARHSGRSICCRNRASSISTSTLQYFAKKYDPVLARLDEEHDTIASVRGTPYRRVAQLYAEYIHKQRDEVRTMEGTLASLKSSTLPAAR